MTDFFYNLLVFITYLVPGNYVWVSIVIITILIRLAFVKPTISMTKMQHKQKGLQGKIAEIKENHKEDKKAQQQATLELYKKEGVNPLGSCLPMIIQIVVLIAFYRIFTTIGLGPINEEILYSFTPRPGELNDSFFGLDISKTIAELVKSGGVAGTLAWGFPLLAGATQLIQALQMKALQPKSAGKGAKGEAFQAALNTQFVYFFPVMLAYISYTFIAALSIYWIVQTVLMVVQQKYVVARLKPAEAEAAPTTPVAKAPSPEAPSPSSSKGEVSKKRGVVVEVRQRKR